MLPPAVARYFLDDGPVATGEVHGVDGVKFFQVKIAKMAIGGEIIASIEGMFRRECGELDRLIAKSENERVIARRKRAIPR